MGVGVVFIGVSSFVLFYWFAAHMLFHYLQSHFRNARALRVGRPLESFKGPFMPFMRAQKDLRRAAFLGDFDAALADTGGRSVPPVCFL